MTSSVSPFLWVTIQILLLLSPVGHITNLTDYALSGGWRFLLASS